MEETILNYIQKEYITEEDIEIKADSALISSGIIDSFSMVALKRFLEKKYKISIPDEKATPEMFDSVKKITKLVQEILEEKI